MTHHETQKTHCPNGHPYYQSEDATVLHGDALALLRELPTHSDYPLILHGDCVEEMRQLPEASVHAVVTDPPYGLGFMGKAWDALPPGLEWAQECLRVLKPGGHLLAFGGTRTWHRLAVAIEDAGFDIRDSIAWLYGSGFPKSLDVSKAIDKAAGVEFSANPAGGVGFMREDGRGGYNVTKNQLTREGETTPEAEQWSGWGTALKPAFEPVVVARKPLAGTVAANVLAHGTGALNIDGCRIGTDAGWSYPNGRGGSGWHGRESLASNLDEPMSATAGRWPANVVLDESQAAALDEQSGESVSKPNPGTGKALDTQNMGWGFKSMPGGFDDQGGASRFFPTFRYEAKADASERPRVNGTAHPTVKPLDLMRWLVRLVTPPGGIVLEPFAGSGTTVEACIIEGFRCIAIEREADYLPLIDERINRNNLSLFAGGEA